MGTMEIEFGHRLSRILAEKGWDQAKLAKKMAVSGPTVSRWLSGKDFPRPGKLKKLWQVLGVTPTELLGDSTPAATPDIKTTLEKLKTIDTDQLIAELKTRGFPEKAIEFVRSLEGKDLEPWQEDGIAAILKGGKKET